MIKESHIIRNLLIILVTGLFAVTVSAQNNEGQHYYSISNLSFRVEKLRLDGASQELRSHPNKTIYLVCYNETGKRKITATKRLKESKNYLIKKYHIAPKKIVAVYGGIKEFGIVMNIFVLSSEDLSYQTSK